jgi:hypothetical protein
MSIIAIVLGIVGVCPIIQCAALGLALLSILGIIADVSTFMCGG